MIKHLRNLLLRLLADNNGSRKILQENKNRALNLVARINNALEGRVQDLTLESDAKSFYEHITESL